MGALPILVILVVLGLAVAAWLRLRSREATSDPRDDRLDTVVAWPPETTRVLAPPEVIAYRTLVRALPGHMVLAKVPLARFVRVPRRHSYSEWLRRLGYQCADFVVCDMASEIVAVVNVRRAAGETSERAIKRYRRMARVLKAARIPMHDWADDALPTPERAREMLLPAAPEPLVAPTRPRVEDSAQAIDDGPREPPPSTWFDEFNSGPAPLNQAGGGSVVSSARPARTPAH